MSDRVVFSYDADGNPAGAIDIGRIMEIPDRIIRELLDSEDWTDRSNTVDAVKKHMPNPENNVHLSIYSLASVIATLMQHMDSLVTAVDEASGLDSKKFLRKIYAEGAQS